MPTIIDNGTTNTVVVERTRNVSAAVRSVSTVRVASPGPQGPAGQAGASGAGLIPPINFSFGDASPAVILTLTEASEIVSLSLQIEEAFNGAGASIALGVSGDTDAIIAPELNDPTSLSVFEYSPRVEYAAGTQLLLTITPGAGASTGRGQLVVSIVPTT